MAEKTATRQAEGNGKPGQKSVTVNKNNTTTGAKNQAKGGGDD
jgi:hypothetical protein